MESFRLGRSCYTTAQKVLWRITSFIWRTERWQEQSRESNPVAPLTLFWSPVFGNHEKFIFWVFQHIVHILSQFAQQVWLAFWEMLKLKGQGSHNDSARAYKQVHAFINVGIKFFLPVRVGCRSAPFSAKADIVCLRFSMFMLLVPSFTSLFPSKCMFSQRAAINHI